MSLNQINTEYNTNMKTLINKTNQTLYKINKTRMNTSTRRLLTNNIQIEYKNNVNFLNEKRKVSIKQIGKLINTALIVGINYIGTNNQLYGCINDANTMKEFVSAHGCDKILMMTDKEMVRPIKINILAGLTNLLLNTKENETAIFYYSGHGTNIEDTNHDESDGLDEGLFTLDGKLILDDELNAIIKKNLKQSSTLFIMCDCCHSGTMIDLKYNYTEDTNTIKDTDISGHVYYISGCRDSQVSMETFINNKSQGALTNAFINSLSGTETWKELIQLLRTKLIGQTPQLSSSKMIDINEERIFF